MSFADGSTCVQAMSCYSMRHCFATFISALTSACRLGSQGIPMSCHLFESYLRAPTDEVDKIHPQTRYTYNSPYAKLSPLSSKIFVSAKKFMCKGNSSGIHYE